MRKRPRICSTRRSESEKMTRSVAPRRSASSRARRRARYSASLFVARPRERNSSPGASPAVAGGKYAPAPAGPGLPRAAPSMKAVTFNLTPRPPLRSARGRNGRTPGPLGTEKRSRELRRRGRVVLVEKDALARVARHDFSRHAKGLVERGTQAHVTGGAGTGDGADHGAAALALAKAVELGEPLRGEALLDRGDLRPGRLDLRVDLPLALPPARKLALVLLRLPGEIAFPLGELVAGRFDRLHEADDFVLDLPELAL